MTSSALYVTAKERLRTIFGNVACLPEHAEKRKREAYTYQCSGAVYEGEWVGGMRHGTGTMAWNDGAQYHGEWSFNEPSREGKFTYPNGDIYEGGWAMNCMCGYGVFRHSDGTVFRGMWD